MGYYEVALALMGRFISQSKERGCCRGNEPPAAGRCAPKSVRHIPTPAGRIFMFYYRPGLISVCRIAFEDKTAVISFRQVYSRLHDPVNPYFNPNLPISSHCCCKSARWNSRCERTQRPTRSHGSSTRDNAIDFTDRTIWAWI